jgi:hypothetical protein
MILFEFTASMGLTLITAFAGLFVTVALWILVHIGNSGAKIKQQVHSHGERIAHLETGVDSLKETAHRVEDKIDKLLLK